MKNNQKTFGACWLFAAALLLLAGPIAGCSEDSPSRSDSGSDPECSAQNGTVSGELEMVINEDLLDVLEVRFLKGRCVARLSIDSQDETARTALVAFANAVADKIPLDGSKPATEQELKEIIPTSNEIAGWEEDPADTVSGPWSLTKAWNWINGGAASFENNGFEAVAGEAYLESTNGWRLELEVVNMGWVSCAEAGFRQSKWDEGTKL